ncbi:UNVERIFIED_CONTAM: hypothetical protein GTU68_036528 [Idotea baltica]|nr:hypothetical protein [Idotea baltica]
MSANLYLKLVCKV